MSAVAERRRRFLVVPGATLVVLLLVAGALLARLVLAGPTLLTSTPTSVTGTEASAVFRVGDRTIRQVRYDDRGTLRYRFALANPGHVDLAVTGVSSKTPDSRLFHVQALLDHDGDDRFTVPRDGVAEVELVLRMSGCETLSARAGSFLQTLVLETERLGVLHDDVEVILPEELHTGSPREAFCPDATATSRSPG